MGQKIVNNIKGSTVCDFEGGNKTVINYCNGLEKKPEETSILGVKTIFLSYNWHDGDVADSIDEFLSAKADITVKRDIRDIGEWKSIREFMGAIREQDYAVLIISDNYLKSRNCMFEVMEIMKEREYKDRIFPAVVERGIYNPLKRVEYIQYWEKECETLKNAIKGIDMANAVELAADLKRNKNIAASIGEFLALLADMNNPEIEDVAERIEKSIFKENSKHTYVHNVNSKKFRNNQKQAYIEKWNARLFLHQGEDDKPLTLSNNSNKDTTVNGLERTNLVMANLSRANLEEVNLKEARLRKANLNKTDLSKAILTEANLNEADLSNAVLNKAKINKADLSNAILTEANLSEADLTEANLNEADLSNAILNGAKFNRSDLRYTVLKGAKFINADLREACLVRAKTSSAILSQEEVDVLVPWFSKNNNFNRTNLKIKIKETDFERAILRHADLRGAYLKNVNLIKADLEGADLSDACLIEVNLCSANLSNANLNGTCLIEVDLDEANLNNVLFDEFNIKYIEENYPDKLNGILIDLDSGETIEYVEYKNLQSVEH